MGFDEYATEFDGGLEAIDAEAFAAATQEQFEWESHPAYRAGFEAGLVRAAQIQSAEADAIFRMCSRIPENTRPISILSQSESF